MSWQDECVDTLEDEKSQSKINEPHTCSHSSHSFGKSSQVDNSEMDSPGVTTEKRSHETEYDDLPGLIVLLDDDEDNNY